MISYRVESLGPLMTCSDSILYSKGISQHIPAGPVKWSPSDTATMVDIRALVYKVLDPIQVSEPVQGEEGLE